MEFNLDDAYFGAVEATEISRGSVHVDLEIVRGVTDFFTLDFSLRGTVGVQCDVCLEEMDQPIEARQRFEAQFGEDDSEDDDLLTVSEDEGILDVAWLICELVELAIPIKHVHAPGKCDPAMIRALEEHSAARSGEESEQAIDPRWEALMKLKEQKS